MSVKSSSCCCSRLCNYFCPPLAEAGTTGLKVRRAAATVLTRASQAALTFSSVLLFLQYREYRDGGFRSLSGVFAAKTTAVAAASFYCWQKLANYSERIDEILNAPNLSFEDLYEKNLLHRIELRILQKKFQKMAAGYMGQLFLQLVQKFDLRRLASCGAAAVEQCRFEHYKTDLKKLGPKEVGGAFPLRLHMWEEEVPEELAEEAQRQQKQYDAVKKISGRFPLRAYDLAAVFMKYAHLDDHGDAVNTAERQQRDYELALDSLDSKNWR